MALASPRMPLAALGLVTGLLLGLRLYAASQLGFGDSEALYASYALHPQPAYLDHPGLIGAFARLVGGGTAPSPLRAHVVTALLATAFPWGVALACRACGASSRRSLLVALVVAITPEIAVGLHALTPDLLLAYAWIAALGLAARSLASPAGGRRAAAGFAAAGVLAGIATASKVTGVLLGLALAMAYASPSAREHRRTAAPWAGLVAGAVVVEPIAGFEARLGWPMLHHRLVDTQGGAGVSLRNLGALVGGQLLYLSPLVLLLAVLAARVALRGRSRDPVDVLLASAFAVPLVVLVPLCLWSRVAEPHWLAPPLLALAMAAARSSFAPSRRLFAAACGLGGAMVAAVHAWVLVPGALRLAPASYDARVDIANELRGWPDAVKIAREEADDAWSPGMERGDVAVVGPHWVICAQLDAALSGAYPVGCDTPVPDDYDGWFPRARWRDADVVVWVDDGRFPPPDLAEHIAYRTRTATVFRAGRVVRTFTVTTFARRAPA